MSAYSVLQDRCPPLCRPAVHARQAPRASARALQRGQQRGGRLRARRGEGALARRAHAPPGKALPALLPDVRRQDLRAEVAQQDPRAIGLITRKDLTLENAQLAMATRRPTAACR